MNDRVDLRDVDREFRHRRQGRVTSAKVADGDPHSLVAKDIQGLAKRHRRLDMGEGAFGDLDYPGRPGPPGPWTTVSAARSSRATQASPDTVVAPITTTVATDVGSVSEAPDTAQGGDVRFGVVRYPTGRHDEVYRGTAYVGDPRCGRIPLSRHAWRRFSKS